MCMAFRLNKQKATEAAGVLLRCAPNKQMTRLRILKLLYMADRESLIEKGRPITGDRIVAMDHGPVLSGIYDIIKNSHADPGPWPHFIKSEHNDVILMNDPGVGELSRYEVKKLQEIWHRYEDMPEWEIVDDIMHKLPEYVKHKPAAGSSRHIPHRDVMIAAGVSEEAANRAIKDASEDEALDRLWARVTSA